MLFFSTLNQIICKYYGFCVFCASNAVKKLVVPVLYLLNKLLFLSAEENYDDVSFEMLLL